MHAHARVLRNSTFNLAGVAIPAVAAIVATPVLLAHLGPPAFGVLAIQIAVLTIIGINDFGVSRAIVIEAVARDGFSDDVSLRSVTHTGLDLLVALTVVVGGVGLVALAAWASAIATPIDILLSWALLIASSCASLMTLPLRASLEVQERFGVINLLRVFGSSSVFISPMIASLFWPGLAAAGAALFLSRLVLLGLTALAARPIIASYLWTRCASIAQAALSGSLPAGHARLLQLAGWIGTAGVASAVIGYSDRFALAFTTDTAAVGNYAVISELVTKVWMVSGALVAAATPRLAHAWKGPDRARFDREFSILCVGLSAISAGTLLVVLFGGEVILRRWLGVSFHPSMVEPLRVLTVGISINVISTANFLLMMIGGRQRAAAAVQIFMLPLAFAAYLAAAHWHGPVGVAWVFTLRLIIDAPIIYFLTPRRPAGDRGIFPLWIQGIWAAAALGLYWVTTGL